MSKPHYDDENPTRPPAAPPFPVGARVKYNGKRSVRMGDTPTDGTRDYSGPRDDEWITIIEPGIEVTICEVHNGRQGTGRLIDPGDGDEPFIDATHDGYSVYRVSGKHRTHGRVIYTEDAHEWQLVQPTKKPRNRKARK